MADIDKENVYRGLGRSNHILSGRNEFDDGMIELGTCPSISRLVAYLIPVEKLRDFVRHIAHAASPAKVTDYSTFYHHAQFKFLPITAIYKLDVRVDISSAPSATRDDGVRDHGDWLLSIVQRPIRCDDQPQRDLRLVQKRG
jgi:hypothetical protein